MKTQDARHKTQGGAGFKVILRPSTFILCCALAAPAGAQQYPAKPIRYIVGYTPAGTADMLARAVGQKLYEAWGQQVIVENRPGAGTNIGTEVGAKAPPDGYTLFMPTVANAINPTLYPKLNYDMMKDFAYVTNFAKVPGIVVCHPSTPVKNAKELAALAKANPNSLRHGSTGVGSPHHLAAEIFKTMAGVKMIHVPYRGASPALTDVMGGQIEIYFGAMVSTIPHVKSGRLRALGVTSLKPTPLLPDLPAIAESGVPGYSYELWWALFAPAGVPPAIVARLNTEIVKIINMPDVQKKIIELGAEPVGDTAEQFGAFVKTEVVKWGDVVKKSGAKVD